VGGDELRSLLPEHCIAPVVGNSLGSLGIWTAARNSRSGPPAHYDSTGPSLRQR